MQASQTRRFYVELVGYRESGGPLLPAELLARAELAPVLDALGARAASAGVTLRLAVLVEVSDEERARHVDALGALAEALHARHLELDVWPQLPDDGTRFLNTQTVATLHARLVPLLDALAALDVRAGLCLDVEPPQAMMDGAAHLVLRRDPVRALASVAGVAAATLGNALRAPTGRAGFVALGSDLRRRGHDVHVAVLPPFLGGAAARASEAARNVLLGCPTLDGAGAPVLGRLAPMCYGSMLRLGRDRARARERRTIRRWAARHAATHAGGDEPLAVGLGLLSTGVLREEPVYSELRDLEEDVAIVRELGYRDLAYFSLEGLLWGASGVPPASLSPTRGDWRSWLAGLVAA